MLTRGRVLWGSQQASRQPRLRGCGQLHPHEVSVIFFDTWIIQSSRWSPNCFSDSCMYPGTCRQNFYMSHDSWLQNIFTLISCPKYSMFTLADSPGSSLLGCWQSQPESSSHQKRSPWSWFSCRKTKISCHHYTPPRVILWENLRNAWVMFKNHTRKEWLQFHGPSRYLFNSNAAMASREQGLPLLGWTSPGRVQGLSRACAASLQGLEGREGARWPQSCDCGPSACSRPGAEPTLTPEASCVIPCFVHQGGMAQEGFRAFSGHAPNRGLNTAPVSPTPPAEGAQTWF